MKKFECISLILLSTTLFLPVYAQSLNNRENELAIKLDSLAKNSPHEIAYIQTSKDIYETGEDLWFKVYLLDAQYLIPSGLSKTLYLQLLNESTKKAVWQEKYEIQDGFANGQVYLDSNLPEGDYLLAAYTANSIFNDTADFYAVRRIKVVNDITSWKESTIIPGPVKTNSIQFTIFPEGGNLVSGIPGKVAYKAVNKNGEPVDIKGTLFEDNSPLLEFKSMHAGMGSFTFTPDNSKKYAIRLSEPAIDSTFNLPRIYSSGMTMQLIRRDKESLSFKVSQNPELSEEDVYLRVQCRGVVYGMTMAKLTSELMIKLPLAGLPQGIAEVTLFNSSLIPVAERLVYINQDQKLNMALEISEEIYPTRGKGLVKIIVKDENGDPVVANLGVSIFDKLYQNPRDSNNILVHYFLSTQLKGRIYNPSFYFNSNNKDRYEAMDLLMVTQGWRKYVWNEANLKKFNKEPQKVIFDGIRGEINLPDKKKKSLKNSISVMAFSPSRDSSKVFLLADSVGNFSVSPYELKKWENNYVYLKPFGTYGSLPRFKTIAPLTPVYDLRIQVADPFKTINQILRAHDIIYPLPVLVKPNEIQPYLYSAGSDFIKIKEVTIKGQKRNTIREKYLGILDSLAKFDMDNDYVCRFGVLNCPRHSRYEFGSTKPVQGELYHIIINYNTPYEHLMRIIYSLPIYTEEELLRLNNLTKVKAYYGLREFYKPDYDKESETDRIPDFRNTLLWEPSVITDENGEAILSFFCSDINSDFVGRIEGVSGEGLLGTGYFNFTVRKLKATP